jgi:hypothetical protein
MKLDLTKFLISLDGDEWTVVNSGVVDADSGTIYLHLKSTTRFRQQKNGKVPVQMAEWLPLSLFEVAA